ncbi:MAG: AMP-binding protein [Myxococcales bacterium]|nr:AMP-binding protein [Myxococcales bacterium]
MVSGGAPLRQQIFNDLRGYGFSVYEGYGLTEAAPVLTVGWPGERFPAGTVGWPLPGIEVRIDAPDADGTGEIVARGPTIMSGYLEDPEATSAVLRDGWLCTGDRGYFDEAGRLYIVGRTKDVIIDASGKNVYPDEIEELYSEGPFLKELSVVGIPSETVEGEQVAALVVPDYALAYDQQQLEPHEVRDLLRRHFREVGSKLPFPRRIKLLHFHERELPRTSTRKIKRGFVREELLRREARTPELSQSGSVVMHPVDERMRRVVAMVAQRRSDEIHGSDRLVDTLGFDSLLQMELLTALESEFPKAKVRPEELASAETVADLLRLLEVHRDRDGDEREVGNEEEAPPFIVPRPLAWLGKYMLGRAQFATYDSMFDIEVEGRGNIPANRNFIVACNHASHLDMGLAKYALGELGRGLRSLAAKDYFFDDPYRRAYFENFTNLLPIERTGRCDARFGSPATRSGPDTRYSSSPKGHDRVMGRSRLSSLRSATCAFTKASTCSRCFLEGRTNRSRSAPGCRGVGSWSRGSESPSLTRRCERS